VQSELLAANPNAPVRVYALWTSKQFGDGRDKWDAAGMTDARVVHLWDERNVAGEWLLGNVSGNHGSDWDTYVLWGPEARWDDRPTPPRSSGAPVDDHIDALARAIGPLLSR
jgi:hypothetical protein